MTFEEVLDQAMAMLRRRGRLTYRTLQLQFQQPVAAVSYGPNPTALTRHVLGAPSKQVSLVRTAAAGSMWVAAVPRTWETSRPAVVSWFPSGSATMVSVTGSKVKRHTAVLLTALSGTYT